MPKRSDGKQYAELFYGYAQNLDKTFGVDAAIAASGNIKGTGESELHEMA